MSHRPWHAQEVHVEEEVDPPVSKVHEVGEQPPVLHTRAHTHAGREEGSTRVVAGAPSTSAGWRPCVRARLLAPQQQQLQRQRRRRRLASPRVISRQLKYRCSGDTPMSSAHSTVMTNDPVKYSRVTTGISQYQSNRFTFPSMAGRRGAPGGSRAGRVAPGGSGQPHGCPLWRSRAEPARRGGPSCTVRRGASRRHSGRWLWRVAVDTAWPVGSGLVWLRVHTWPQRRGLNEAFFVGPRHARGVRDRGQPLSSRARCRSQTRACGTGRGVCPTSRHRDRDRHVGSR